MITYEDLNLEQARDDLIDNQIEDLKLNSDEDENRF